MANDLWDNWKDLNAMFDLAEKWYPHAGAGHWPDADMIPIGKLQGGRSSKLSTYEKYTLMTLWCIIRSPLIWGGNLLESSADDLKLMQNSEVIAVNQNSTNNKPVVTGNTPIWYADIPGSQIKYVAVFNRNDGPTNVTINFSSLGVTGSDTLRDLWAKSNLGVYSGSYTVSLAAHQSKLYRLTPPGATMVIDRNVADAGIVGSRAIETAISNGNIVVRPQSEYRKFSVSVFTPDGQLVTRKKDIAGTVAIPVRSRGIYIVNVNYDGHLERNMVSFF